MDEKKTISDESKKILEDALKLYFYSCSVAPTRYETERDDLRHNAQSMVSELEEILGVILDTWCY